MGQFSHQSERLARYAVIAVAIVAVGGALNLAAVAVLPVVAAMLLCVMLWPLRAWLTRWLPAWLAATACCLIVILMALTVVGWAFYASMAMAEQFGSSQEKYVDQYDELRDWLSDMGMPRDALPEFTVSDSGGISVVSPADEPVSLGAEARGTITSLVTGGLRSVAGIVVALSFTIFLTFLALLEGERWARWSENRMSRQRHSELCEFTSRVSVQTRSYFLSKAIGGLITGTGVWVWLTVMDVPMAIVWAIFTVFMNFIPNIGAVLAGIPPSLLAVVELGWGGGLIVAAGLVVIESGVANLIEPFLQGSMMKLSPFVVLVSLIFWGWLWGIAGAVMAPVLTAAILAAVSSFKDGPGTSLPRPASGPRRDG
ncbi:MAG: AI-2E family transporter [Phycisphaerales bacterium]